MNFLAMILFKSLTFCLILDDPTPLKQITLDNAQHQDFIIFKDTPCQFKIEDKLVSEIEYKHFCDSLSLTEIEGTYVCKKMSGGGHYWYDAKAIDGQVYVVGGKVVDEYCLDYIHRKK